MFKNYINKNKPFSNDDDLTDIMLKQLIVEAFIDNEEIFDAILNNLKLKDINLLDGFTIYPEYTGSVNNNDLTIERNDADNHSFLGVSTQFIKNEKYLIKLIDSLKLENINKNENKMTFFLISLLENGYENSINKIIKNKLLTEHEIKVKVIFPEDSFLQKKFLYKHDLEFLCNNIHHLKITKSNEYMFENVIKYALENSNEKQYKILIENINNNLDYSNLSDYKKEEIIRTLVNYAIINPEQMIGINKIDGENKFCVKSFLKLSDNAIENIKEKQMDLINKKLGDINKEKIKAPKI